MSQSALPAATVVGTMTVRQQSFEVRLDYRHHFETTFDETPLSAVSWGELEAKLADLTKKPKATASVPIVRVDSRKATLTRGTVTSFHRANGNPLVTWANGKREQLAAYDMHDILDGNLLTEDLAARLLDTMRAANRLHEEIVAIIERCRVKNVKSFAATITRAGAL